MYVCLGGSAFRELDGEVARWVGPSVGVMGETGGRTGDAERERESEREFGELPCWERGEVSTVRPGIVLCFFFFSCSSKNFFLGGRGQRIIGMMGSATKAERR